MTDSIKQIPHTFTDPSLLTLALTQAGANAKDNNERLEFLADRVLGLAVAEMLYAMFPDEDEGKLARRYSALVSTNTLMNVSKQFGLDKMLKHGHLTGGSKTHVLANAMESVIAAIYLDAGWDTAARFVHDTWRPLAAADITAPKDPKTTLQEIAQRSEDGALPVYKITIAPGGFNAVVTVMGKTSTGFGVNKKMATIDAAENMLKILSEN